jgi:hypothetical protein
MKVVCIKEIESLIVGKQYKVHHTNSSSFHKIIYNLVGYDPYTYYSEEFVMPIAKYRKLKLQKINKWNIKEVI